jgi:hypothetical protein
MGSKLELARENLRVSRATEARIAANVELLRKSGKASPEVLADYEAYLGRVKEMVAVHEGIVEDMESVYARHASMKGPVNSGAPWEEKDNGPGVELPDEEAFDELAPLDRELNESLAAFDEMLLRELEDIRAKSADKMTDLAHEAAAAARRLRERGVEVDTAPVEEPLEREETVSAGEESPAEIEREGERGSEEGTEGKEMASRGESREGIPREGEPGPSGGYDDDIVARQIREAAEKETDPELKAKLWKEYEEYKRGRRE